MHLRRFLSGGQCVEKPSCCAAVDVAAAADTTACIVDNTGFAARSWALVGLVSKQQPPVEY